MLSYCELWVRVARVEIILERESAETRDIVRGLYYQKIWETLVYAIVPKSYTRTTNFDLQDGRSMIY
jgi:hypothetical protein